MNLSFKKYFIGFLIVRSERIGIFLINIYMQARFFVFFFAMD
jgi:hypothetical protein